MQRDEFTDQELLAIINVFGAANETQANEITGKAKRQLEEREAYRKRRSASLYDELHWLTGTGRYAQ